jgi:hypothetical protein
MLFFVNLYKNILILIYKLYFYHNNKMKLLCNMILLFILFINNIYSFEIINYNCDMKLLKYNTICKRLDYNDVCKIKNNVNKLYIVKQNRYVILELQNNTIYNYKNSKKNDILGILHIISLFT